MELIWSVWLPDEREQGDAGILQLKFCFSPNTLLCYGKLFRPGHSFPGCLVILMVAVGCHLSLSGRQVSKE